MKYNILIVDDSEIIQRVIARIMDMIGLPLESLRFATDGVSALDVLASNPVDLVFTGMNMPGMDGMALVARMRDDEMLRRIPIAVISAEQMENRFNRINHPGVRAYIRKPFSPEIIRDTVREILVHRSADESSLPRTLCFKRN